MTPTLGALLTQARMRRAKDEPRYSNIHHLAQATGLTVMHLDDIEMDYLRPSEPELMSICVALCIIGGHFSDVIDAYGRRADAA